jgi:hypothetical protein
VVRVSGYRSKGPWFDSPALPDFLRCSGSGTGSTQPREDMEEIVAAPVKKTETNDRGDPLR